MHPTRIEINLTQLKKNIREIKKKIQGALFLLPIKANAYGFGLFQIAKAALEEGVDYLGVAFASEAIYLRKKGIQGKILLFGAVLEEEVEELVLQNIDVSISSAYKAKFVTEICQKLGRSCAVHLEIDTGMRRTGMRPETAELLREELKNNSWIKVVGVYSHLATSNKKNCSICLLQLKAFDLFVKKVDPKEQLLSHVANSGGIENYPGPLSFRQMVRPGLLTYGYSQNKECLPGVKPCFSLKSRVSFFKVVEKGDGVGYGHSYKTAVNSRIVTIPIGYGDGYKRALSNKGSVLIRGQRYPIVGNICMDQLMVDIGTNEAFIGDEVVLIGKMEEEEISLGEIAKLTDSIPYEIFSSLTQRIPRVYLD